MSLVRRCVSCPAVISPVCDPGCGDNEVCVLIGKTCDQCGGPVCQSIGGSSSGGSNNGGAIAGGVVAALIAILLAVGFIWYRRRRAMAAAAAFKRATVEVKPDIVASADTVLNRPDPLEKPASLASSHFEDVNAIRLGAMMVHPPENPFADHVSIATASDRATNVIPIGLITPRSTSIALSHATQNSGALTPASVTTTFSVPPIPDPRGPNTPMRPQRAGPEIDMRLDLSRPASEAPSSVLLPPKIPYAHSSRSGLSSRASTLSTSSSFLNEAPQIVTPKQANFRQVLGVQRAEVVKLGSTPPSPSSSSIKSHSSVSTAGKSHRSPLGQAVYEANDAPGTPNQSSRNPFTDQGGLSPVSPSPSPAVDWDSSRPTSTISAVESIANISSAQRVQLVKPTTPRVAEAGALLSPSPLSTPRSADFRTAGQLSPPAQAIPRSFDEMTDHRNSQSSLAFTNRTSTTDSILEAFPFVPPSPMSLHNTSQTSTPIQRTFQQQQQAAMQYSVQSEQPQPPKPSRSTIGLSTISSASSGLGNFTFQFESDSRPPLPPGLGGVDERASLDTIQLSRDLAEFPLPGDSIVTPKAK